MVTLKYGVYSFVEARLFCHKQDFFDVKLMEVCNILEAHFFKNLLNADVQLHHLAGWSCTATGTMRDLVIPFPRTGP